MHGTRFSKVGVNLAVLSDRSKIKGKKGLQKKGKLSPLTRQPLKDQHHDLTALSLVVFPFVRYQFWLSATSWSCSVYAIYTHCCPCDIINIVCWYPSLWHIDLTWIGFCTWYQMWIIFDIISWIHSWTEMHYLQSTTLIYSKYQYISVLGTWKCIAVQG